MILLAALTLVAPLSDAPVLLDAHCDAAEYTGAARHDLGGLTLLAQHDDTYVYLCIPLPPDSLGTMDLYLQSADGALHNLHVSAQVGERVRGPDGWPEWRFGNQQGWYGPPVPFRGFAAQGDGSRRLDFAPSAAREVQIGRARFGPGPWRIRLEVRALNAGRDGVVLFPANSRDDAPDGWARLEFAARQSSR